MRNVLALLLCFSTLILMIQNVFSADHAPLPPVDRKLHKVVVVNASLDDVWAAWTTNEGAQTFFSARTNIDPSLGGHYEIYFAPDQPYGKRGAEGCRVQS